MPKYFPGVTHCLVQTPITKEDMQAMGNTIATVHLCFAGDFDILGPIRIKKMEGPTSGATAHIPITPIIIGGKKNWIPILRGKLADEAKLEALIAFDKVKQQFGLKFGKTYKVFAKTIEEIGVVSV